VRPRSTTLALLLAASLSSLAGGCHLIFPYEDQQLPPLDAARPDRRRPAAEARPVQDATQKADRPLPVPDLKPGKDKSTATCRQGAIWAQQIQGAGDGDGTLVAVDAQDNIYLAGIFSGSITAGKTTLTAKGGGDVFLVSFKADGTVRWAESLGGTSSDAPAGLAVHPKTGDILLAGSFYGPVLYTKSSALSGQGGYDIFFARYKPTGKLSALTVAGGAMNDLPRGLAVDAAGSVYLSVTFYGAFKTVPGLNSVGGSADALLIKLNPDGSVGWSVHLGGKGNDVAGPVAVSQSGGALYWTGYFSDKTTTGPALAASPPGQPDGFLLRVKSDGTVTKSRVWGGAGAAEVATSVLVGPGGHVYMAGHFTKEVNLGKGKHSSKGLYDLFLGSFDAANLATRWSDTIGSTMHEFGGGLVADGKGGRVYFSGLLGGAASFGKLKMNPAGTDGLMLVGFSGGGSPCYAGVLGGSGYLHGRGLAMDSSGHMYQAARLKGLAKVGVKTHSSAKFDAMLIKWKPE